MDPNSGEINLGFDEKSRVIRFEYYALESSGTLNHRLSTAENPASLEIAEGQDTTERTSFYFNNQCHIRWVMR
jgi:hypothetical protein